VKTNGRTDTTDFVTLVANAVYIVSAMTAAALMPVGALVLQRLKRQQQQQLFD